MTNFQLVVLVVGWLLATSAGIGLGLRIARAKHRPVVKPPQCYRYSLHHKITGEVMDLGSSVVLSSEQALKYFHERDNWTFVSELGSVAQQDRARDSGSQDRGSTPRGATKVSG